MRKVLLYTVAIFAALSMTAASADGLCSVTATADCDSVTVSLHVPKGENGHTVAQVELDGVNVGTLEFDGVDGTMTVPSEGTEDVAVHVFGTVTVGEKVKDFDLSTTAARDCTPETTPPPSTTPPPPHTTKPPAPPLAFTGGPSPLPFAIAAGALGLLGLGLVRMSRRHA